MSDPFLDDDLHALFARQREADCQRTPDFQRMSARALRGNSASRPVAFWASPWCWAFPAAAALGLAIAAIVTEVPHRPPHLEAPSTAALVYEIDQARASLDQRLAAQGALTAWQSPTDFLLNPSHDNTP